MPNKKKHKYNTQYLKDGLARRRAQYQRLPTLYEKAFELQRMTKMEMLLITKDTSGNIVKFGSDSWLKMYEENKFTAESIGDSRQWNQDDFSFFSNESETMTEHAEPPNPSTMTSSTTLQIPPGHVFRNNLLSIIGFTQPVQPNASNPSLQPVPTNTQPLAICPVVTTTTNLPANCIFPVETEFEEINPMQPNASIPSPQPATTNIQSSAICSAESKEVNNMQPNASIPSPQPATSNTQPSAICSAESKEVNNMQPNASIPSPQPATSNTQPSAICSADSEEINTTSPHQTILQQALHITELPPHDGTPKNREQELCSNEEITTTAAPIQPEQQEPSSSESSKITAHAAKPFKTGMKRARQDEQYEVEKILDKRKRRNRFEFLIKWLNYPSEVNSWEPRNNINSQLTKDFDSRHQNCKMCGNGPHEIDEEQ